MSIQGAGGRAGRGRSSRKTPFLAGLWLLSRLLVVVMILLAALILAGTLGPAVERLQQCGMRRWLAIGLVITALLTVTILFITLTIPSLIAQATSLVNQEPVLRARMGHWLAGALFALPVAAAVLKLAEELRLDMPGHQEQASDIETRERDDLGERECERRAEGMPAAQAAAIAVEISEDRQKEENLPPGIPQ